MDRGSAAWACDDDRAAGQARSCRQRAAEMLTRALERGEGEMTRSVAQTLVAELWRRAGCFDDALAACEAAAAELEEEGPGDLGDGPGSTAVVVGFIRGLAEAGDDGAHNCAEAFAEGE